MRAESVKAQADWGWSKCRWVMEQETKKNTMKKDIIQCNMNKDWVNITIKVWETIKRDS